MASTGDDAFDMEALQAQVDLTMAFAHELASSWISPSLNSSGKSRQDTEKMLEEYMRRPPRLGVGAPIPENAVSHRETARLKNRLTKTKNKRARGEEEEEEEEEEARKQNSSDEEESRARAIKKKAKLDAFRGPRNGKRHKSLSTIRQPSGADDVKMETCENGHVRRASSPELSKSEKKRRRKKLKKLAEANGGPLSVSVAVLSHGKDSKNTGCLSNQPDRQGSPILPSDTEDTRMQSFATPIFLPSRTFAGIPLLNLDGPPVNLEDDKSNLVDSGLRKKRKRRNKRRKSSVVGP